MMKLPKERPMTHYNPYVEHLMQKGYTERELRQPAAKREVPAHLQDRYASYEEYQEAMADFLNGM
jgi:hypothetical protein